VKKDKKISYDKCQVCLKKHIDTLSKILARGLMPSKHAGIVLTFYCMSILRKRAVFIELSLLLQVQTAMKL
jgi:hypothetical protein